MEDRYLDVPALAADARTLPVRPLKRVCAALRAPRLRPPSLSSQLRARLGPLVAAFVTFAPATSDQVVEVIGAVVVGDLVARLDILDSTQEHAVADLIGSGIRPAGMVGVAAEIPASRTIDGPAAIDLIEIAVAVRL